MRTFHCSSVIDVTVATNQEATTGSPLLEKTDVVVVGNGPSALTLSFLLNGNWPYYDGQHPDEVLHARLSYEKDKSIMDMDFAELCAGISGQSRNVVANLFDQLLHPSSVFGDVNLQPCVSWKPVAAKIPHLILGPDQPGGAWQKMHGNKKALSFNNWLELPGLPVAEWARRKGCSRRLLDSARLPLCAWKAYYRDYPLHVGIEDNLRLGYHVTSLRHLNVPHSNEETGEYDELTQLTKEEGASFVEEGDEEYPWEIRGIRSLPESDVTEEFLIHAKKVVLATGTAENPKQLQIAGEFKSWTGHTYDDLHKYVVEHSVLDDEEKTEVDSDLAETDGLEGRRCWNRVLVVGSGLTAADAVMKALNAGCHVYHLFNTKHSVLAQLSDRLYPEYSAVWKMMIGERPSGVCGYYTPFANGRIKRIQQDHRVSVENAKGVAITLEAIDYVAILIGSAPTLSYVQAEIGRTLPIKAGQPLDAKRNPVAIDQLTHQCFYQPGMFALGPLCGDNYVRFIPGGAVAVAKCLFDQQKNSAVNVTAERDVLSR